MSYIGDKDVVAYKGFDRNLKCRGFQYEVGKTYRHDGPVVRCARGGFHSCENPLDVWNYYGPLTSRFALVTAAGAIDRAMGEDTKIASAEITIKAEVNLPGFVRAAAAWVKSRAKATTGDRAHSATTGNYAHSATTGNCAHSVTTGDRAHSATTGNCAHSATTGDRSHSATTGNYAHSVTTGDLAHSVTTGNWAHSVTTGDRSHSATTGDRSHSATTGNYAHSRVSGKNSIAAAFGRIATAQADEGGWIVIAAYDDAGDIVAVRAAKVGGPEGIMSGVPYMLTPKGEFVPADESW